MTSPAAKSAPSCKCTHFFIDHFGPLRPTSSPPSAGGCKSCNGCTLYRPDADTKATLTPGPKTPEWRVPTAVLKPEEPAPMPPTPPAPLLPAKDQPVSVWPKPGAAQEAAKRVPIRSEHVTDQMLEELGVPHGRSIALFRHIMQNPGCDSTAIETVLSISGTNLPSMTRALLALGLIEIRLAVVEGERSLARKHYASMELLRKQVVKKAEEFQRLAKQFEGQ